MHWTVKTTRGCFEGSKIKQILKDMIEYYGSNGEVPEQIEFITTYDKNDREKVICEKGTSFIQEKLEYGVFKWWEESKEEATHQEDLRNDYKYFVGK